MNEFDKNRELIRLLQKLDGDSDVRAIELLGILVANDTPSMKKTFELITTGSEVETMLDMNLLPNYRNNKNGK